MVKRRRAVLITGAAQGLGHALLDTFASRGWTALPLVRREDDARALMDRYGPSCFPVVADIRQDDVGEKINQALDAHAPVLDLLINNAGIVKKRRGLSETTPEDLIEHFDVHCVGAFRCIRAALPFLEKAGNPMVVNISSRWGSIGLTAAGRGSLQGGFIYSYKIAKCAMNMLTVCLHEELRPRGVRVAAVHPGRIKTRVAPSDAEVEPSEAAAALYEWVERSGHDPESGFYDISDDSILPW